jgi:hypothetical protein
MLYIPFLIAGFIIIFKKEIKISSKRSIKGGAAQKLGLLYFLPGILTLLARTLPTEELQTITSLAVIAGYIIAILATIYLVFFYKPKEVVISPVGN